MELEALHIPKTAGSSFLLVLIAWYGRAGVLLHYPGSVDPILPSTRAAYGHFPVFTYEADQRICWIRDPAWRLISEFFFFRATPQPDGEHNEIREAVAYGAMSFSEFINDPRNLNQMTSGWLKGATMDDFAFIGLSEHFDRELVRLATILGMPHVQPQLQVNTTDSPEYAEFKRKVTPEALAHIREIHATDSLFYNAAVIRAREWYDAQDAPA